MKLASEKKTKSQAAIKIMNKSDLVKEQQVDHILSESVILSSIDHPFIVISISLNSRSKCWGAPKINAIYICSWSI